MFCWEVVIRMVVLYYNYWNREKIIIYNSRKIIFMGTGERVCYFFRCGWGKDLGRVGDIIGFSLVFFV